MSRNYAQVVPGCHYRGEGGTCMALSITPDPELLEPTIAFRTDDGRTGALGLGDFFGRFPEVVAPATT